MLHRTISLIVLTAVSFTIGSRDGYAQDLKPIKHLQLQGMVESRLNKSYQNQILARDVDHLIQPFKSRNETRLWQSEFWGKWITAAQQAYQYQPTDDLLTKLNYAIDGLMQTQSADGYIGNYAETHRLQQWDIWGRKYCLLGLLGHYDITRNKKVLKAASRLADNLIDDLDQADGVIVTKGNFRGMAASSVLEPICLLYNRTKEQKYLDFAKKIVSQWEQPNGPQLIGKSALDVAKRFAKPETRWFSWEQGQKAYEMMSCYEGLVELYRITGDQAYLAAVEQTWQNIKDTEINFAGSGASTEMWFDGRKKQDELIFHYQETCVTVTWIKLSHQLLRLTGNSKYADAVEETFYNALLGAMAPDASRWAKYTPLTGRRLPGSGQCGMDLNCCEASGPRGLFNMPGHIVMQSKNGFNINYYIPGDFVGVTPQGEEVTLKQVTTYPETGAVQIQLKLRKPERFTMNVRIPSWSQETEVVVQGEIINNVTPGGFLQIERLWRDGDVIDLDLDMRGRVLPADSTLKNMAIMRGPILLARDASLDGPPVGVALKPVTDADGFVALKIKSREERTHWLQFSAKFIGESYLDAVNSPIEVELCDYASAGYGNRLYFYSSWFPQLYNPSEL